MAYSRVVEFLETSVFTRRIQRLMTDEEYSELQQALLQQPDLGDVIRGSGGLRKIRWRLSGRGKRGGARVIYFRYVVGELFYMLYAFSKDERDNLTRKQVETLKCLVSEEFK